MAELVSELTKVAGEVKRPSKTLTGQSLPRTIGLRARDVGFFILSQPTHDQEISHEHLFPQDSP